MNKRIIKKGKAMMNTQEFIGLAISSGCVVEEYDHHYVLTRTLEVQVFVTLPKVSVLVEQVVRKLREMLGI